MKARPLLLNGEMVRAVLDDHKGQTRRPFRIQPPDMPGPHDGLHGQDALGEWWFCKDGEPLGPWRCPFGAVGDLLWVRETWTVPAYEQWKWSEIIQVNKQPYIRYRATDKNAHDPEYKMVYKWRPSIHMPRWASRLTLRVLRVWIEQVQSISATDALSEGTPGAWIEQSEYPGRLVENPNVAHVHFFSVLWDSIYAKRGFPWDSNCWVWACEFEVVK